MANRILVYDAGKNVGFSGTATGQVLTWNDSADEWELGTPMAGTVTSITAGTGLTGGVITSSGTIAADFGNTSGKIAEGNDNRFPPAPGSGGRILYDDGSAWVALAAGAAGKVLQSNGAGAPSWESAGSGTVTSVSGGTGITITGTASVDPTVSLAALSPAPTGSYGSASSVAAVTVDQYGRVTSASSTSIAVDASAITSGQLGVARGGTGATTIAAGGIVIGNGINPITTKTLGQGELLIGSAVGGPDAATLSAGTGVTITNGNHSIEIAIGQAVGTTNSPTFSGATFSGLTANRFVYTGASKQLVSLANGAGTLAGYDTTGDATAITLGTGLSMAGSVLSASGSGGTVTSVALDLGTTGLKLAGNVTSQAITSSGTFTLSGTLAVANGGTGLTSGTSGGVLYYSAGGTLTSSAALSQYELVLGGGAGAAPATLGSKGTSGQVLTSNGASANPSFQSLPYDLSGEAAGTPEADAVVFHFRAARAFTLKGTGHVAYCDTAPVDTTTFTIKQNGSSIGTIEYSVAGGVSGTVTITSGTDTAIGIGDRLTVTAPASLNSIVNPFWTFLGTCP